ncbi:MAG: M3 family metallopeptidase [Psittacicella sp.]
MQKSVINYPNFSAVETDKIVLTVKKHLEESKEQVLKLLQNKTFTWSNFVAPIDEKSSAFSEYFSPISHLDAVKNTEELRKAIEEILPLSSEYSTWFGQNKDLFNAYQSIANSEEFKSYSPARKKAIENTLRGFKHSGVNLEEEKQKQYAKISLRLSELSHKFSNNVMDSTMKWEKIITDVENLKGLPKNVLEAMKQNAKSKEIEGYRVTLDYPILGPILTYCENESLREEIYIAYNTRASDQGPLKGEFDNTQIIEEILKLKKELANLLGFETYANLSLDTKMAETPKQIEDFLNEITKEAAPIAKQEVAELQKYALDKFSKKDLKPWDIGFYSEKMKEDLYSINDEEIREFFPEDTVLKGMFEIVNHLYGIVIKEHLNADVYHKDVKLYDIYNKDGSLQGAFYIDLYAREHKRGGAWMNDAVSRYVDEEGVLHNPVAYLNCNFNAPVNKDEPALFSHSDVTTIFHEFGHTLHHLLTQVDVSDVSGINGVAWDAVELPSQFMENWCWNEESLKLISRHYKTNKPLDKFRIEKMMKAKNFHSALFLVRQVEFGMFDIKIYNSKEELNMKSILEVLNSIKKEISPFKILDWTRFPHSFSHIFGGGYSAGYYSYLWAEVLSADAFSKFENEGILNQETGLHFLNSIISQGGVYSPMELFTNFMGRKPDPKALLRSYGIIN